MASVSAKAGEASSNSVVSSERFMEQAPGGEAAILSNRCAQIAYLFIDGLFVKAVAAMSGGRPWRPVRVVPFTGRAKGGARSGTDRR
jgi:hypothetical protein